MKFENTEVWGFEHAIRGARNPMNSWDKSDSFMCYGNEKFNDCISNCDICPRKDKEDFNSDIFCIGKEDMRLMQKLIISGSEHRKFMRQIFVSVDITAPLYWWKEADTYKVGTVANSCSTMHKIHSKEFTLDDFSYNHLSDSALKILKKVIEELNKNRKLFNETKDKQYWWNMIQLLPTSYNQKRTITMNYENLLGMCSKGQRRFHKLDEWSVDFINWARTLPYAQELIFIDEVTENI